MPQIQIPFAGGCACGAIRYECRAEPIRMLQCHCRDCQRSSGGSGVFLLIVPADALKIMKGTPRYYPTPSFRGGYVHRGFCADCGSPVLGKPEAAPQLMAIRAGSLDDPSAFQPTLDMWTSEAQPWDFMNPDLPKFPLYPPFAKR